MPDGGGDVGVRLPSHGLDRGGGGIQPADELFRLIQGRLRESIVCGRGRVALQGRHEIAELCGDRRRPSETAGGGVQPLVAGRDGSFGGSERCGIDGAALQGGIGGPADRCDVAGSVGSRGEHGVLAGEPGLADAGDVPRSDGRLRGAGGERGSGRVESSEKAHGAGPSPEAAAFRA